METGTTPQGVEALIAQLYQPSQPHDIARIQETLQGLQRSDEGWQLADQLLASRDEKVQFFGALTFMVKINLDSKSLSDTDSEALLQRLITWLLKSVAQSYGTLIIRKLCSALVAYFLHFPSLWTMCIRHLVFSFCNNEARPVAALQDAPESASLIAALGTPQVLATLWFSASLVEEVSRTDSNSLKTHGLHEKMLANINEVTTLMATALAQNDYLCQEALKCYQSWVSYSHKAYVDEGKILEPLRTLTKPAISLLTHDATYEISVELLTDTLSNFPRFLDDKDFSLLVEVLRSPWAQDRYEKLTTGDFSFEQMQFGQFMLAFGDATVDSLVRSEDEPTQNFLTGLGGLLAAEGYVVAEDQIFVPALEFWATFVEVLIDSLYSEEGYKSSWLPNARTKLMDAIEKCWRKIQLPPVEEFLSWDSTERTGFYDARQDVADLLQSSYTLTGFPLLEMFGKLILQSLEAEAWGELEASLFCLSYLADCISNESTSDDVLNTVFSSPLFIVFSNATTSATLRPRQAALVLIEKYADRFARLSQHLPNALGFLFQSIETPSLAGHASKSINTLCSSCRTSLSPHLEVFLNKSIQTLQQHPVDPLVKDRILGAIAGIVQSLPSESAKLAPLEHLLRVVGSDIDTCLGLVASSPEEATKLGVDSLRALVSIAKALQNPSDVPLDLDAPEPQAVFWKSGAGRALQEQIHQMIVATVTALHVSGEVIEAACSVFRAGFAEQESPFAFPTSVVVDFLLRLELTNLGMPTALGTACSLVSSHREESPSERSTMLSKLAVWLVTVLRTLNDPGHDPEIAQNGIDLLYRLLPRDAIVLTALPVPDVEFLLMFTLRAMTGRDPLPKAASCDFWSCLVSLNPQSEPTRSFIAALLDHHGPLLAQALIYNIGGNASRSELDKISKPLKKLVVQQVRAKQWLEAALSSDGFVTNEKIEDGEKRVFLGKVMSLRGAGNTNAVVREFWLLCRGSKFAYVS